MDKLSLLQWLSFALAGLLLVIALPAGMQSWRDTKAFREQGGSKNV